MNVLRRNLMTIVLTSVICGMYIFHNLPIKKCVHVQKLKCGNKQTTSISNTTAKRYSRATTVDTNFYKNNNDNCTKNLLKGNMNLKINYTEFEKGNWPPTLEEIAVHFNLHLKLGGYGFRTEECNTSTKKLAVIVPFRDRETHLRFFLYYTHELLQRQQLEYVIFVVEQSDHEVFNKGQMMNTGFLYALNQSGIDFDCYIFHDVDMISEDDRTLYQCKDDQVVHLSNRIDKFKYKFCCGMSVGGVLGFTRDQFTKINGYSNRYYGWGGEDDDINFRILKTGQFTIYRPTESYSKFKMIMHKHDTGNSINPKRFSLLEDWKDRQPSDGINNMRNIEITKVTKFWTHTRILVKSRPLKNL